MVLFLSRRIIVIGKFSLFSFFILKSADRYAELRFPHRHGGEECRSASLGEAGGGRPA